MPDVSTHIAINAAPARAWTVLTDFAHYANWNPFIVKVDGVARSNSVLKLTLRAGKKNRHRDVTVLQAGNWDLSWRGDLFLPVIFNEEHHLKVQKSQTGCMLLHYAHFSGLLCALLGRRFFEGMKGRFMAMNTALKARAEGLSSTTSSAPGSISSVR